MTTRIQHIIDEIRRKTVALHHQLTLEREKNGSFQLEIQRLNDHLEMQKQKEEGFLSEIATLKMELEATKSQVIEVSVPSVGKTDDEIDELVREIEYCIGQLKK